MLCVSIEKAIKIKGHMPVVLEFYNFTPYGDMTGAEFSFLTLLNPKIGVKVSQIVENILCCISFDKAVRLRGHIPVVLTF